MIEYSRAKFYIVFAILMLVVFAAIALYTLIEDYIGERGAKKRVAVFKTKRG